MQKLKFSRSKILTAVSLAFLLTSCKNKSENLKTSDASAIPDGAIMGDEGKLKGLVPKKTSNLEGLTPEVREFTITIRDMLKSLDNLAKNPNPKLKKMNTELSNLEDRIEKTPVTDKPTLIKLMAELKSYEKKIKEQAEKGSEGDKARYQLMRGKFHEMGRDLTLKIAESNRRKDILKN
ncbi:MAG: hypothetical protein AABX38_05975 [Candidatus Micrarchaeota archaeon]